MKKTLGTVFGVIAISTTLPALAGPDFQLIEQARKAKQERVQMTQTQQQTPLQADPQIQMETMMKKCMEMMKKS